MSLTAAAAEAAAAPVREAVPPVPGEAAPIRQSPLTRLPEAGSQMYKTTVSVEGMMCSMCEAHINEAIRKAFPQAKQVKSSHSKGISSFISEEEADKAKLAEAIEATGYRFVSATSEPYEKKKLFGIF